MYVCAQHVYHSMHVEATRKSMVVSLLPLHGSKELNLDVSSLVANVFTHRAILPVLNYVLKMELNSMYTNEVSNFTLDDAP